MLAAEAMTPDESEASRLAFTARLAAIREYQRRRGLAEARTRPPEYAWPPPDDLLEEFLAHNAGLVDADQERWRSSFLRGYRAAHRDINMVMGAVVTASDLAALADRELMTVRKRMWGLLHALEHALWPDEAALVHVPASLERIEREVQLRQEEREERWSYAVEARRRSRAAFRAEHGHSRCPQHSPLPGHGFVRCESFYAHEASLHDADVNGVRVQWD